MPPTASSDQARATQFPRDIGAGMFLLAIAAFGYAGAMDLPSIWAGVGPGLMPKLVAGLTAALGLLIMGFGLSPRAERLQRWSVRGPVFVLGSVVVFAATGPQTIRIQTREDGFRIDQVVLSAERYLNTSPGALKNDTTILR